jgi:rhodanese-related sulfurtransferase
MTVRDGVGYRRLLEEAEAQVESVTATTLAEQLGDDELVVIDIRDVRELEREGQLPGALHMPRGMLEFWIDPESPYARPIFQEERRFVFYCRSGWRSALATAVATRLGLQRASHLEGGFGAWQDGGFEVVPYERRRKSP